ncbi:MAG TPA: AbrB/MazE/SpoVT family DNA-binding domain-containing protein [Rhizomicrobium sp.]|jgi:antitoxin VapB|nr:AbrB/MazE/SpoVT family DNA-binding domain-containing protein [Rhizomicrobium sp.]
MRTCTFKSGNSQAVRLPAEIAYPENTEVEVTRTGEVITIYPARRGSVKEMVEELRRLPKPSELEKRVPMERTRTRKTRWD